MAEVQVNPEAFQESITKELEAVKDRVRNLIGNANWGEDGRYKEAVLTKIIKRFLPSNLSVGTGFILKAEGRPPHNGRMEISNQLDIIIYDNRVPVLFSEGSLVIVSSSSVRAIIEVKTKIANNEIEGILRKSIENAKMVGDCLKFNGVFSYEYGNASIERLSEALEPLGEDGKYVNHTSLGSSIFIKYWSEKRPENVSDNGCKTFYGLYDFSVNGGKKLSFSYFISNLIYSITVEDLADRLWLLFPVEDGKESVRVGTACLQRRIAVNPATP
ncbi:MAG: hypothetical protein NWE93_04655 [Candidatus Bathyarchaeota archaeon]|nr:hypothetical protein [Candidatus Bathyarchaeota archaeon]